MTEQALKTIDGRISTLDFGTRKMTFRPDGGFAVDIFWSVNQDEKLAKFKEGYKAKVTYETDKLGKHWLSEIVSTYKPGDKRGFKEEFSQKNDELIAKEVLIKALFELKWNTFNEEKETYDSMCEDIVRNFEMIMPRFLKAGDGK